MTRASRASIAVLLVAQAIPSAALAQRAEYAAPDALPEEGIAHAADVALLGTYGAVVEPDRAAGLAHLGTVALRSRLALGRALTWTGGLDAEIGGSDEGLVYGVTGWLAGVGLRLGAGNLVSLTGGVGVDGVVATIPAELRIPGEAAVALAVGPVRPVVWLRPVWLPAAGIRKDGASLSFVDELEVGFLVRLGRQHRYWADASAARGLAIGASYRELLGTRAVGAMLGIDLEGEQ